ncbi:sulfatase-like hydrolase/transferase [Enterococcus eurekensis]|uniref:Sulfatase-like hydrolase/transferase n=1 Tax=Enterococcus eurekensis TaxID=1159753 RepID=A0ABV9M4P6_9ENTE
MFILCGLLLFFAAKILPRQKKVSYILLPYLGLIMSFLTLFFWRTAGLEVWNLWALLVPFIGSKLIYTLLALLSSLIVYGGLKFVLKLVESGRLIRRKPLKKRQIIGITCSSIVAFLGILLGVCSVWAVNSFGNMTFDQMVYTLSQPLGDSDPGQVINFIENPFLTTSVLFFIIFNFFLVFALYTVSTVKIKTRKKSLLTPVIALTSFLVLISSIFIGVMEIGYADIKAYYFEESDIYDRYYVDPTTVNVTFPEEKRNLIYIFLESMESSYASQEVGGIKENNLIPNLTQLAMLEGTHFSNTENLGGFYQVPGANQTASSMVAQTSGLPLRAAGGDVDANNYGQGGTDFFPGAYSIGEILEKEGYNQRLMMGSSRDFAGRGEYFTQHGNYTIQDVYWARQEGLIPEDYWEWWGFEDRKLFDFAKDSITELANQEQPFNFTMLTVDTHFEDGYATEETPDLFGDQYQNVIYDNDRQLKEFLDWIKSQPFYENTTVVLVGDHLTMDSDFFEEADPLYQRTVYNTILNAPITANQTTNRQATALDMFPTTLAALGVNIEGERLGLGTNLFSKRETLAEQLSFDRLYTELTKRSEFYNTRLMKGTDEEVLRQQEAEK